MLIVAEYTTLCASVIIQYCAYAYTSNAIYNVAYRITPHCASPLMEQCILRLYLRCTLCNYSNFTLSVVGNKLTYSML